MNVKKLLLIIGVIGLSACDDGGVVITEGPPEVTQSQGSMDSADQELPEELDAELEIEFLAAQRDDAVDSQTDADDGLVLGAARPASPEGRARFAVRDASRFLNQATFGTTRDSLDEILAGGWRLQWITKEFSKPRGESYHDRLNKYYEVEARSLFPNGVIGENQGAEYMVNVLWDTWINSPDQLRKRITATLLEIFVINARVGTIGIRPNQLAAANFLDILDKHAFGNFRDLLYDVSLSPAMGVFLSYMDNQKAEYNSDGMAIRLPDENYAREILQLFTIGLYELNNNGTLKKVNGEPVETYDQQDILNLARVFTGFVRNRTLSDERRDSFAVPMIVNEENHSSERKRFLGKTIPAGTGALESLDQAIDIIFNHPNIGPFIGKQLIQRLVSSNPSESYIERVANAFNDNGEGVRGDMKAVILAVLRDPEGMSRRGSDANRQFRGHLKEPMMRFMHIARTLSISTDQVGYPIGSTLNSSFGLSQSPLKSQSVFNFFRPGHTPPRSELAENNLVAPEFQVVTGSAINGSINFINDFILNHERWFESDTARLEQLSSNPKDLVRYLNVALTHSRMGRLTRAEIEAAIEAIPSDRKLDRVKIALVLASSTRSFLVGK